MIIKTKAVGVRLPVDLINLCKSAAPALSFSEIVRGALEEKYELDVKHPNKPKDESETFDKMTNVKLEPAIIADGSVESIESIIDGWCDT